MAASTFHEARILYKTDGSGQLLDIVAFHGIDSPAEVLEIYRQYQPRHPYLDLTINELRLTATSRPLKTRRAADASPTLAVVQYELKYRTHTAVVVMVTHSKTLPIQRAPDHPKITFRDYLAMIMLTQDNCRQPAQVLNESFLLANKACNDSAFVEAICGVFEEYLLFCGPDHDRWEQGRPAFTGKLRHFVQSRSRVRFCLPAFPCKSSNPDKVAGLWPDGAEFEALTSVYTFCRQIKKVYPPGCVFEVISDGHVFSDCIGVDDHVVTEYNARLRRMSDTVRRREDMDSCVTFRSLHDILQPLHWIKNFFRADFVDLDTLNHPVTTKRTIQDDNNRAILMQSCSPSPGYIQQIIRSDPSNGITALYRGFSRFMLDDLASQPECRNKSKS